MLNEGQLNCRVKKDKSDILSRQGRYDVIRPCAGLRDTSHCHGVAAERGCDVTAGDRCVWRGQRLEGRQQSLVLAFTAQRALRLRLLDTGK